jgi:hypothetical protein
MFLGEGLWRGHANQGRCQPGRRAVLEETSLSLTTFNSTLSRTFSQAELKEKIKVIMFIFK